jgi:hypothetical protein
MRESMCAWSGNLRIVVATNENGTFEGELGIGRDEAGGIRDRGVDEIEADRDGGVRVGVGGDRRRLLSDAVQRPARIRI